MVYDYEIIFPNGERACGRLVADNQHIAALQLKSKKCCILKLKMISESRLCKTNSSNDFLILALYSYKLAVFWQAGIPLLRALQIIAENIDKKWQRALLEVIEALKNGSSLASAIEGKTQLFTKFYVAMIAIAEQVGLVDKVLFKLAKHYNNLYKLSRQIKKAIIYPSLVLASLAMLLVFFVVILVPVFISLYETLNIEINSFLLVFQYIRKNSYWLLGTFVLLVLLIALGWCKLAWRNKVKFILQQLLANCSLAKRLQELQFCQIFSLGLQSGLDILTSVNLTKEIIVSHKLKKQLDSAIIDLSRGCSLLMALQKQTSFISASTLEMLAIGEETGQLEQMLELASQQLEYNLKLTLNKLEVYLQPVCLIVVALVLAVVLVVLLQPLLGILAGLDATI